MRYRVRVQRVESDGNVQPVAELRVARVDDREWQAEALDRAGLRVRVRFAHPDGARGLWHVLRAAIDTVMEVSNGGTE